MRQGDLGDEERANRADAALRALDLLQDLQRELATHRQSVDRDARILNVARDLARVRSLAGWRGQVEREVSERSLARTNERVRLLEDARRAIRRVMELHERDPGPPEIADFWSSSLETIDEDLASWRAQREVLKLVCRAGGPR